MTYIPPVKKIVLKVTGATPGLIMDLMHTADSDGNHARYTVGKNKITISWGNALIKPDEMETDLTTIVERHGKLLVI